MRENHIESEIASDESMPVMLAKSKYAGKPVDVTSRRSIEILQDREGKATIAREASHTEVNYFYHEGRFWRAVIPLDGVDEIYGQAFNFSKPKTRRSENGREIQFDKHGLPRRTIPILNHVQSRFKLKPDQPVELFPLGSESYDAPVHRIYDFIYSLEAVGPVGVCFNLWDGLAGNLLSAHRFMSIEEMVFERLVVENEYVTESPPLPLDEQEKRAVLIGSLLSSHQAGMTERYYLYRLFGTNNCTSSPFQIVDSVVKYRLPQRIGSALYRLPFNPRFYLWVRGLDSDPSIRKLVRNEFEAFIADSSIQQRKQDHLRRVAQARQCAGEEPS